MADYFFDTSALVKRHVTEVGTAWVKVLGLTPQAIAMSPAPRAALALASSRKDAGGAPGCRACSDREPVTVIEIAVPTGAGPRGIRVFGFGLRVADRGGQWCGLSWPAALRKAS